MAVHSSNWPPRNVSTSSISCREGKFNFLGSKEASGAESWKRHACTVQALPNCAIRDLRPWHCMHGLKQAPSRITRLSLVQKHSRFHGSQIKPWSSRNTLPYLQRLKSTALILSQQHLDLNGQHQVVWWGPNMYQQITLITMP